MWKRREIAPGYIFLTKGVNYIFICEIWLFELFFPQYYKPDMSKYVYLEVFRESLRF